MNRIKAHHISIFACLMMISCGQQKKQTETSTEETVTVESVEKQHPFTKSIEDQHGAEAWAEKEAITFDLNVEFGGNTLIDGSMTMLASTEKTRIDLNDSAKTVAVFDGENAFVSPSGSPFGGARFHLLTWPYFLAAPFKLNDPGSELEEKGEKDMFGNQVPAARLTFESGVGDTPDDWYVVFKDKEGGILKALAYIVTFGKSTEKANEDPHAVVYDKFQTIDGVTLSTLWDFYGWNEEDGFSDEKIGKVIISNVKFTPASETDFSVPEDSRKEELPSS